MPSQNEFAAIQSGFEELTKLDIVIAPWLAMSHVEDERLARSQQQELQAVAQELSLIYRSGTVLKWTFEDFPTGYLKHAYYEILLSTAAYLSYQRLGTLVITDEMMSVASVLVRRFLDKDNGSVLIPLYVRVMTYLDGQVFDYYGKVHESVFVSANWHRPWTSFSLQENADWHIKQGHLERLGSGPEAELQMTAAGRELYELCRTHLEQVGYLKQREQLMRATSFTNMDEYERIMDHIYPHVHDIRRSLIRLSGISSGMRVLELGCGSGGLTLDDGLYDAVGPEGLVVSTDPSIGMIRRAKEKQLRLAVDNVEFLQAGAELLPFPDNTFDAAIGCVFLHFTDIPRALAEIYRVTKPGGTFTSIYPLEFSKQQSFFTAWFEPIYERGLASSSRSVFPHEELVPQIAPEYFDISRCDTEVVYLDFSHIDEVVTFLVGAGTMAELNDLPMRARQTLFGELISRGHQIKHKYGANELQLAQVEQWFKGTVRQKP